MSDDDFAEQIRSIFGGNTEPFKPFAFYNEAGDEIEFFLSNDNYYGQWINHFMTVYRSEETNEIIGGCIHQLNHLMKKKVSDE